MSEEVQTLAIDNGPGMCKAGFAGDEAPRSVFQIIGCIIKTKYGAIGNRRDKYGFVCDEAWDNEAKHVYTIEHGIVTNWEDMEVAQARPNCDAYRV